MLARNAPHVFGFGLGYTSWEMGAATVSGHSSTGVTVAVPVRNTGARAGSTVVQCYIEPALAEPGRPVRTLQGFARVNTGAGDASVATIELDERAFSRWDPATHSWAVTAGDYRVLLGWSSRDLSQVGVSRAPALG